MSASSISRQLYILPLKHRDDNWTECVSSHPPDGLLCSPFSVLCRWQGYKRPFCVLFRLILDFDFELTIQVKSWYDMRRIKSIGTEDKERPAIKEKVCKDHQRRLRKGYVVKVKDAHKTESRPKREWYQPHNPVVNPNKPNKALMGAAKCHIISHGF